MDKKYYKHMKVEAWYLDTFTGSLAYVQKSKKKGQGKGRKDIYVLTELKDGAWDAYMNYLRTDSPQNYALTILHLTYLQIREEVMNHGDVEDFEFFREEIKRTVRDAKIPMRYVRQYNKLTFEKMRDPQNKRVEMQLMPVEF